MNQVIRKAILIGSPGRGEDFLPGVKVDIDNMRQYLLSERGGVFFENEIITLYRPNLLQVAEAIYANTADYLLVYFSGHGFTNDDRTRMISLRDCSVSDLSLLNDSPRQLIIIDACRNYIQPGIAGIPDEEQDWSYIPHSLVRQLFDEHILHSPTGRLIVHATESGKYSYESVDGGYFTSQLLKKATEINTLRGYLPITINTILSRIEYSNSEKEQVPSVTYEEGNLQVPFSIAIPAPLKKRLIRSASKARQVKREVNVNWAQVGLLALLFLALVDSE